MVIYWKIDHYCGDNRMQYGSCYILDFTVADLYNMVDAFNFKKGKMVTDKQKSAVHFCEDVLKIKFEGNIENSIEVSNYLSKHLHEAKMRWRFIADECLGLLNNSK